MVFARSPLAARLRLSVVGRQLVHVSIVAALAAAPAQAATPPRAEAGFGTIKGSGAYLTREQLRECFVKQDKLRTEDAELIKEQASVNVDRAAVARGGAATQTRLDTLDRTNAEAVSAYNEAVEARNKQVEAFQARATTFNERVGANAQTHASFSATCSNRRYFEEDATAIRKGR